MSLENFKDAFHEEVYKLLQGKSEDEIDKGLIAYQNAHNKFTDDFYEKSGISSVVMLNPQAYTNFRMVRRAYRLKKVKEALA